MFSRVPRPVKTFAMCCACSACSALLPRTLCHIPSHANTLVSTGWEDEEEFDALTDAMHPKRVVLIASDGSTSEASLQQLRAYLQPLEFAQGFSGEQVRCLTAVLPGVVKLAWAPCAINAFQSCCVGRMCSCLRSDLRAQAGELAAQRAHSAHNPTSLHGLHCPPRPTDNGLCRAGVERARQGTLLPESAVPHSAGCLWQRQR